MGKIKRETRISREQDRLKAVFAGIDANKMEICEPLIARAAFITISLEDLEADLTAHGWTEEYQNGANQSGRKKSAAADVHISLTKNLNAITKQLLELAPEAKKEDKLARLVKEIQGHD